MAYHSSDGEQFVGLREVADGRHQVVFDTRSGQRLFLNIEDPAASPREIDEALREGVMKRNVLLGVVKALCARKIRFEYPARMM